MLRTTLMTAMLLALAACSNFTPREKTASYDPKTKQLALPSPCPDWSQTETHNYRNEYHSNYGCAVNTNSALQLADPADLYRGHGDAHPDTDTTTKVIQKYHSGELPVALTPTQGLGGTTQ